MHACLLLTGVTCFVKDDKAQQLLAITVHPHAGGHIVTGRDHDSGAVNLCWLSTARRYNVGLQCGIVCINQMVGAMISLVQESITWV